MIRRLQDSARRRRGHHALHAAGAGPDDRGPRQPHAVPVHRWRTPNPDELRAWAPKLVERLRQLAAARRRGERPAGRRAAGVRRDRPRRRGPLRHHAGHDRQRALQRLRPAPRLDDLHADQPVPRRARGRARVPQRSRARQHLRTHDLRCRRRGSAPRARCRCRCRRSPPSPSARRRSSISHIGQFPAATISFNLAPGRVTGRGGERDRGGAAEIGLPVERAGELPGRGARLPRVARQPAAADPGGDRHHVHRAGRALRELHPSRHDPVDAAVGRRRRAAGADRSPATISASSRSSASSC